MKKIQSICLTVALCWNVSTLPAFAADKPPVPRISTTVYKTTNQPILLQITTVPAAKQVDYRLVGQDAWSTLTTFTNETATTKMATASVTANGKYEFRIIDAQGALSDSTLFDVSWIDQVAPTAPTIQPRGITERGMEVAVTYSTDAFKKEYRLNGGVWTSYYTNLFVKGITRLEARGTDEAGNVSEISIWDMKDWDAIAPSNATFIPSTTQVTDRAVRMEIRFPNDAALSQYRIGTGMWTTYTGPFDVVENATIYAKSRDASFNWSAETSYVVSNIDKKGPAKPSITSSMTSTTSRPVTVTISYDSKAIKKEYRLNQGTWMPYVSPVAMSQNGLIEARATDALNRMSEIASYVVSNIDTQAPTTPTITATKLANTQVVVTVVYPADAARKEYQIGSGSWNVYVSPVTVTKNEVFKARSVDVAGNTSPEATYQVSGIDVTPPEDPALSASETRFTNQPITITAFFATDATKKEYRINQGAWQTYTSPFAMNENGTIEARATDAAGNVSKTISLVIKNIDKVAPKVPVVWKTSESPTLRSLYVFAEVEKEAVAEYRIKGSETWRSFVGFMQVEANGTWEFRARDGAGNVSSVEALAITQVLQAKDLAVKGSETLKKAIAQWQRTTVTKNMGDYQKARQLATKVKRDDALYLLLDNAWKRANDALIQKQVATTKNRKVRNVYQMWQRYQPGYGAERVETEFKKAVGSLPATERLLLQDAFRLKKSLLSEDVMKQERERIFKQMGEFISRPTSLAKERLLADLKKWPDSDEKDLILQRLLSIVPTS